MQWQALLLLAACAQLAACDFAQVDPTTTDSAGGAKGTGCKHHSSRKNDQVTARAPAPTDGSQWPVFTWEGQGYTGSFGQYIIDGQTLTPGGKVRVHNTVLRLPPDGKTLLVRDKGHPSTISITPGHPHAAKNGDKNAPPHQTGEPEGEQRPDQTGDNNDDDCGAEPSATPSDKHHKAAASSTQTSFAAAQTSLGGIEITSTTPLTQEQATPTNSPTSTSAGVAGVQSAAPWLGAAVAGFAWVLV